MDVMKMVGAAHDRIPMHDVLATLLDSETAALGLLCLKVFLPSPCFQVVYKAGVGRRSRIKAEGAYHLVFANAVIDVT